MSQRTYRGLFWALALLGAALDQATKYGVFAWLDDGGPRGERVVVQGCFQLEAHYADAQVPQVNQGALFGLGRDHGDWANAFFAGVSVLAALVIVYWSNRPAARRDGPLCAALGLILAGTLGNLYDRVLFGGVRDFLHLYWGQLPAPRYDWPVFNVADCCLVLGAALLLFQARRARPAPTEAPAEAALASHE